MSRLPLVALLLVVLAPPIAVAAPAPVVKPGEASLPVPNDAMVVVRVRGIGTARDRLTKLVEAAAPDLAPALKKKLDDSLGEMLEGRDLAAVTPDKPVYLVVNGFEIADAASSPVALMLPVEDYKAFRQKAFTADERKTHVIGKEGYDEIEVADRLLYLVPPKNGYVAVTPHKETAEALGKKFDPLAAATLGELLAKPFVDSDASIYVNLAMVNEVHGERIRQFHQLFQGLLQQGGMGLVPGLDKRQAELAVLMYDGLFQAVEDGKGLVLGVEFRPEGLLVRGEATFRVDSDSAKQLAAETPKPLDLIGKLPKGQAMYAESRFGASVAAILRKLNREYAAGEDDDKATEAIDAYADLFSAAAANGWAMTSNGGGSALQALAPKDPAKLVTAHLRVLKNLPDVGVYQNVPLKEKPSFKENAEKHGEFTLHRVTLKLDFDAVVANIPDANLKEAMIASMKRLVSETTTFWFGTDGTKYVQVAAKDWAAAKSLLDEYLAGKETIGANAAFAATRRQLPAEATQVMVIDVAEFATTMGGYARTIIEAMPGFPGADIPEPKRLSGEPAVYAGLALVARPSSLGFTTFVPADAVKVGRKVFDSKAK